MRFRRSVSLIFFCCGLLFLFSADVPKRNTTAIEVAKATTSHFRWLSKRSAFGFDCNVSKYCNCRVSVEANNDFINVLTDASSDLLFSSRILGPEMTHGTASRRSASQYRVHLPLQMLAVGRYKVDLLMTYVGPRYIGQTWSLPDRNDNPPFIQKKKKCLDLKLDGQQCHRFGILLFEGELEILKTETKKIKECDRYDVEAEGKWIRTHRGHHLFSKLNDQVSLNFFDGDVWRWEPSGCRLPFFQPEDAVRRLKSRTITRIALFGDSMIVELFYSFQQILNGGSIHQFKAKKLRNMEFSADGIVVRFMRSYTTKSGQSVIAPASVIAKQLIDFRPQVSIGNLAVLHWQQNLAPLAAWRENVDRFLKDMTREMNTTNRVLFFGSLQIQMGRTQGLEPSRTLLFAQEAFSLFEKTGLETVRPHALSVARRESAFDGQHWACYHQFGGVALTIGHLTMTKILL